MASTLARKTGLTPQLGTRISTQKLDEWLQVTQSMIWKRWGKKWYLAHNPFFLISDWHTTETRIKEAKSGKHVKMVQRFLNVLREQGAAKRVS